MDLYYHPKKNQLEIFQIDNTCPSLGVDSSYYKEGFGWSKILHGYPEDHGWVFISIFHKFTKKEIESAKRKFFGR